MATDWDKLKYEFDLYRKTPRAKRHAIIAGASVLLLIAVLVARLLISPYPPGARDREARRRDRELLGDPALRPPRDFAAAFMDELRDDARFVSVQAIPIAAGPEQGTGIMIQGVVGSEADRAALEGIAQKLRPPVRIDWQIGISARDGG